MAGAKACFFCKKPVRKNEKSGYTAMYGHFHQSCFVQKQPAPLRGFSKRIFPLYTLPVQNSLFSSASFLLFAGLGALTFMSLVLFGVILGNWALALQLALLALLALAVLGPIVYSLYSIMKEAK